MIEIEPFSDLIFVFSPGCDASEAAAPELDKFARENPRMMILRIQADGPYVDRLIGKRVRATPTYVFRRGGRGIVHEGMMKSKDLTRWLGVILKGNGDDDQE
jgi:hypothetical protein